jgi:polysaccharide pyruvyl transferase WcaK-like protein
VAGALRDLTADGWTVRYIPMWPADVESARELERALGQPVEVVAGFLDLQTLLDALAACRVFVGQKLHSVILAAAVHVPSVMLEYHPKCRDFQRSLDRERWTIRTDAVTASALTALVGEADERHAAERQAIFDRVTELRGRLLESAERARRALPPELR